LQKFETNLIIYALEGNNWNQSKAAKTLDIPEQTLRHKMKILGIKKPDG
jgi:DNA-binding NtrC family response regulator